MFYWINAKKIIGKIFIFLSLLYLLFVTLEILSFIFYFFIKFISKFDKTTEFIFLIFIYCIAIFILLKKLFKTNIDNTPIIYDFNLYKRCFNDNRNKIIIFHPEEIKIKDKNDILYFLKLLDIYSFANRKYLVRFILQITFLNIIIFLFSFLFILLNYKDQKYHLIWIGITSLTYILYFFYWINLFSYEKINQIYNKLILKPSFKKNLTFYIVPLRKSLSLSEIFKYSFSERKENFEKYINLMIQILLPISYIAFLTFYIGFKSKG